jgi:hypothetical protein
MIQTVGEGCFDTVEIKVFAFKRQVNENFLLRVGLAHRDPICVKVVDSALDIVLEEFEQRLDDVTIVGLTVHLGIVHFT